MKLAYGGAAIGDRPWHLDGSKPWTGENTKSAMKCLQLFMELDIRFVDTASRYGNGMSELIIGSCLKDSFSGTEIITKMELGSISEMLSKLETSISRLGRVNGILIHNPDLANTECLENACRWLESINILGMKYTGFSTEPVREIKKYYDKYELNIIQFPYSKIDRRAEEEIFPWIGKGILKMANRILGGPGTVKNHEDVKDLIRFAVMSGFVDVGIVGTSNPDHLRECVDIRNAIF